MNIRINLDKLISEITRYLSDVNTGSYESFGYGEDYFDDALNLDDIIDEIVVYSNKCNSGTISYKELIHELGELKVEWNINPIPNFTPFKQKLELLKDVLYDLEEIVTMCIIVE